MFFQANNIAKFFGGLAAVNYVSFSVDKGQIYGLIGPNGSGKTTIFNLINGYYPLSNGEIIFKGEKISGLKTNKICKKGVGRTFQVVKPLRRMSVLDNVMAASFLHSNSKKQATKDAMEIIEFCGMTEWKDRPAAGLPIASRKRLEITRAMATRPELLLLDETAAGLNPTELDGAIDLILKIRESGVTIIIVEHIMKVIMNISDRILAIDHGQVIAEGAPVEIRDHPDVIAAYLGEG